MSYSMDVVIKEKLDQGVTVIQIDDGSILNQILVVASIEFNSFTQALYSFGNHLRERDCTRKKSEFIFFSTFS